MKKRLTAVVLSIALLVGSLAACSDRNDSENSESKVTTTTATTSETTEDTSSENSTTTTEATTTETSKEDDSSSDESKTSTTAVTDSSTTSNRTTAVTTNANNTTTKATTTKNTTTATTKSTSGSKNSNRVVLNVKNIQQNPELPTGCEITATTIALNYYGFNVSKMEMLKYLTYMPQPDKNGRWTTPDKAFIGDPKLSTGYGCYYPVIMKAINDYFAKSKISGYKVELNSQYYLKDLYSEIDKGNPVIIWVGRYMKEVQIGNVDWTIEDGSQYNWISNEHCCVLIGYDKTKNTVILSDPLDPKGTVEYPAKDVERCYRQLDFQSLVIRKK